MAQYDLVILNGLVVTDQEIGEFDIAVHDGKIANVVPRGTLGDVKAKKTIDAEGGMVMVSEIEFCCELTANILIAWGRRCTCSPCRASAVRKRRECGQL